MKHFLWLLITIIVFFIGFQMHGTIIWGDFWHYVFVIAIGIGTFISIILVGMHAQYSK